MLFRILIVLFITLPSFAHAQGVVFVDWDRAVAQNPALRQAISDQSFSLRQEEQSLRADAAQLEAEISAIRRQGGLTEDRVAAIDTVIRVRRGALDHRRRELELRWKTIREEAIAAVREDTQREADLLARAWSLGPVIAADHVLAASGGADLTDALVARLNGQPATRIRGAQVIAVSDSALQLAWKVPTLHDRYQEAWKPFQALRKQQSEATSAAQERSRAANQAWQRNASADERLMAEIEAYESMQSSLRTAADSEAVRERAEQQGLATAINPIYPVAELVRQSVRVEMIVTTEALHSAGEAEDVTPLIVDELLGRERAGML